MLNSSVKRRFKLLVIANGIRYISLLAAISLLLILGGLGVLRGNFWTVEEIRCSLDGKTCPVELWEDLLNASLGKDFLFFPKSDVIRQINLNYPEVDNLEMIRVLPRQLFFKLTASQTLAAIKGEKYFLVNARGLVLKISDHSGDLPVILMDSVRNIGVGEKFEQKEMIPTVLILSDLGTRGLHPTMAKIISPQRINIWLNNGTLIAISLQKEADSQLDSLQVILSRIKMEGKGLREVDLRFDKPVITYE
mgnify:CR=1 FL=1